MTHATAVYAARFVSRPNRFIATVELEGEILTVHVKNTGRCRELLIPGCTVYLAAAENPLRKTPFDLIAVEKRKPDGSFVLIHMDSQAPNDIAAEWLPQSGLLPTHTHIRREVFCGESRFDFCLEDPSGGLPPAYLEVKGCTLERDGVAYFPDAPTERGVRHVRELTALSRQGHPAFILFIIQMKGVTHLCPNDETHRAFGDALREAREAGVTILAVDCRVEVSTREGSALSMSITADNSIPVIL